MISFLWNTYSHDTTKTPSGIAASEISAERCVRRAFEADAAIRGAVIWVVNLTASPDGRQFEWQPSRAAQYSRETTSTAWPSCRCADSSRSVGKVWILMRNSFLDDPFVLAESLYPYGKARGIINSEGTGSIPAMTAIRNSHARHPPFNGLRIYPDLACQLGNLHSAAPYRIPQFLVHQAGISRRKRRRGEAKLNRRPAAQFL
jgi:hypothetical protein